MPLPILKNQPNSSLCDRNSVPASVTGPLPQSDSRFQLQSEASPDGRGEYLRSLKTQSGTEVIFVTGSRVDAVDVSRTLPQVESVLGVSGVNVYFNHTEGGYRDMKELACQKVAGRQFAACQLTEKMAGHLANKILAGVEGGHKVILISHSQGNHLAAEALRRIDSIGSGAKKESIGVIMLSNEVPDKGIPRAFDPNVRNIMVDGDVSELTTTKPSEVGRILQDLFVLSQSITAHRITSYLKEKGEEIRSTFHSLEKGLKTPQVLPSPK